MHQKHPPLVRPTGDHYARTDVALVGSTCARMDALIERWADALAGRYRTLTVIGDHGEPVVGRQWRVGSKRFATADDHWNEYDERLQRAGYDLALVNGNHYPAARQIVFVDPAKAGTLERRREQLTDVLGVVLCGETTTLPDWLRADLSPDLPPVWTERRATETVPPLLTDLLGTRVRALKSLVLLGGKSQRMGTRKADLVYRDGQPEAARLAAICERLTPGQTYLSVAHAADGGVGELPKIVDRFLGLGPAGAIASAFLTDPNAAWLVVACDLPLLEEPTLRHLVDNRHPGRLATAYRRASERFPEPLVAIYEPKAYPRLLQFLAMGYACPRKLLINSPVHELVATDETPFTNANTPAERAAVERHLANFR